MYQKIVIILFTLLLTFSCSKEKTEFETSIKNDSFRLYKEGYESFQRGDYFYASKKFSEAELNFKNVEYAAKAAIMSCYALYGINFYDEALESLDRYLLKYRADKNVIYAHYLIAIIHYEQISDEKKDLKPLLDAQREIDFFLKKYPDSDYSLDLKFKKDLILNQLAAKELYVAKYYISTQKWVPAMNRLKIIVKDFEKTIFIEEALHRLVEINYYIGLEQEAKKYAKILGYNYNSSEWFEQSYKILNKDYKITNKNNFKDNDGFFKRIIKKIK